MTELGSRARMRAADLIDHVLGDLGDVEVARHGPSARIHTDDGLAFDLIVDVERRKLMTLQESRIVLSGPAVRGAGSARIDLHHTGQVRRRGLSARIRGQEDDEVVALRDRLLEGGRLEAASLPLDVTRFRVVPSEGRWRAELTLMGGSHVRTRLPPGGSYVRLAEDQVAALLATVRVVNDLLPVDPDASTLSHPVAEAPWAAAVPRTRTHLPRRSSPPGSDG